MTHLLGGATVFRESTSRYRGSLYNKRCSAMGIHKWKSTTAGPFTADFGNHKPKVDKRLPNDKPKVDEKRGKEEK